ncbi:hypothetical protein RUND412_001392 [Rhizina undulata]
MAYFATIHKASGIRHACKANFLSEDVTSLIVAKSQQVEVYDIESSGLVLKASFSVYGRVVALMTLHPSTSPTEHLFIATDRYDIFTCSWDPVRRRPKSEYLSQDVSNKFLRESKAGPLYIQDPHGRQLGLHIYQGIFLSIPLVQRPKYSRKRILAAIATGSMEEPVPVHFNELDVVDLAFLHGTSMPVVAMLYRDNTKDEGMHLKTYEVIQQGRAFNQWEIRDDVLELEVNLLIPMIEPKGGVMVLGPQMVNCFAPDRTKRPFRVPVFESTIYSAWAVLSPARYLLGDESGKLFLLELEFGQEEVKSAVMSQIGNVPNPTKIIIFDDNHIFVASHQADSQLIKLTFNKKPSLEVLQSMPNLAPVMDFQVMESTDKGGPDEQLQHRYSSGQLKIVSGNGGFNAGSMRTLRSGVGLEDLGILGEMSGIRGLWAVRRKPHSEFDDTLVVTFVGETRIFTFDSVGGIEELDTFNDLPLTEATLLCSNVFGGTLLHVTPSGARILEAASGRALWRMHSNEGKITMASANHEILAVVIKGTTLVLYDIKQGLKEFNRREFEHEIACITIPQEPAMICVVGFWTSRSVAMLHLPDLRTLAHEYLRGVNLNVAVPRSLLLARLLPNHPSLLVAMADGTLYTFAVNEKDCSLGQKKAITLGTQAVKLQPLPTKDLVVNVFATCDHPSLIHGAEGRIVCSAVTAEKTTHVIPFNAEAFPGSVVVSTDEDLKISMVDPTRTTHVQTVNLGNVVRRVAYSPEKRVFGAATVKVRVAQETGEDVFSSYVRLVDERLFEFVDAFELEETELVESLICTKLDNGDGGSMDKFVAGTGYQEFYNDEATRGRIVMFEVSSNNKLKTAGELMTNGVVKCLGRVGDKIIAAVGRQLHLYSYSYPTTGCPKLTQIYTLKSHNEIVNLSVTGDLIAIGDLMKGPSLIRYVPGENGKDTLEDVARIYSTSWITSIEMWDAESFVAADMNGNLEIYKWDKNGVTEEDRRRLKPWADVRIGETVNCIRRVEEAGFLDDIVVPKGYFGTSEGSVYLLGKICEDKLDVLMKLQQNLNRVVKGVGNLDLNRFRAFSGCGKINDEPFRFVDGDFIEKYLLLPDDIAQQVVEGGGKEVEGLGLSIEEVRTLVEDLKRLH